MGGGSSGQIQRLFLSTTAASAASAAADADVVELWPTHNNGQSHSEWNFLFFIPYSTVQIVAWKTENEHCSDHKFHQVIKNSTRLKYVRIWDEQGKIAKTADQWPISSSSGDGRDHTERC